MSTVDSANIIFNQILSFIEYTNQNIFLTGKAGTGKTTLLKKIKESSTKKMVIVAPTGVAAMNAKGTTINSFFQLPSGSFFPGDISIENLQAGFLSIQSMVSESSYNREKTNLLNELELLVIDEVSMVRCDLMDVIDAILRYVRKNNAPFGGVQLLLIGDLYQLPPVIKREDWDVLRQAYLSPYFFDSHVIRRHPLLQVELTTVYRQTEPEFIHILNSIRNNQIDGDTLALLNQRYQPDFVASDTVNPIIITSHNAEATAINKDKLEALPGIEYTYNGELSGEFREAGIQAEQVLKLKKDAQVMFIKNDSGEDRKFYNGKIGKVKSLNENEIIISFPHEEDLFLEKSAWQSFDYKTDPEQVIVQHQVGEFSQYPIKLAWAVTIHKSQGLTFDSAIIDAGKSFVAGQVYVALSRVRTLNGLILRSKINTESLRSNQEVLNFMHPSGAEEMEQLLLMEKEKFILQLVLSHFSFSTLFNGLSPLEENAEMVKSNLPEFRTLLAQLKKSVTDLMALAERFQNQLKNLHKETGFKNQPALQARIESAANYFIKELNVLLINPVNKNIRTKTKSKSEQNIQQLFLKYRQLIEGRLYLLQFATELLKDPIVKDEYTNWITAQKKQIVARRDTGNKKQHAAANNLQLF